jgi:hypothetical protein
VSDVKIFKLNDCDWVAATSLDEAIGCLATCVSNGVVDDDFREEFLDDPYELNDADLDQLKFREEDEPETEWRTFRAELQLRLEAGAKPPFFFASTEY